VWNKKISSIEKFFHSNLMLVIANKEENVKEQKN